MWLTKLLNKSVNSIKKVLQELKSVQKFPPIENRNHAETSQSTHNASNVTTHGNLISCSKTEQVASPANGE